MCLFHSVKKYQSCSCQILVFCPDILPSSVIFDPRIRIVSLRVTFEEMRVTVNLRQRRKRRKRRMCQKDEVRWKIQVDVFKEWRYVYCFYIIVHEYIVYIRIYVYVALWFACVYNYDIMYDCIIHWSGCLSLYFREYIRCVGSVAKYHAFSVGPLEHQKPDP